MRPIVRGNVPKNAQGDNKIYTRYSNARRDLINRIGQYCCYCNMRLESGLAVEHVLPKIHVPGLTLTWTNFLLCCPNCNSNKGNKHIVLAQFLWPDIHNTILPLVYHSDGRIEVSEDENIPLEMRHMAQSLLDLVGLQKYIDTPSDTDRRWKNRKETYEEALGVRNDLIAATALGAREILIDNILRLAKAKGYWPVWLTVFKDHEDVCERLINDFSGTASVAFDKNNGYTPISRVNWD